MCLESDVICRKSLSLLIYCSWRCVACNCLDLCDGSVILPIVQTSAGFEYGALFLRNIESDKNYQFAFGRDRKYPGVQETWPVLICYFSV